MKACRGHVYPEVLAAFGREIDRLRRQYSSTLGELPAAQEATASWTAEVSGLSWILPLAHVREADIDLEILHDVLIVRASRSWPDPAVLVGFLPVPYEFDPADVMVSYRAESLSVLVRWAPCRNTV